MENHQHSIFVGGTMLFWNICFQAMSAIHTIHRVSEYSFGPAGYCSDLLRIIK
jgi:hypothetical protein